jgi:hypothetical protein
MATPDLQDQWLQDWTEANLRYLTALNTGQEPWTNASNDTGKEQEQ